MRVGFIGIGRMGWPMAARLAAAGHELTVHDLDAERGARFVAEHGGRFAPAPDALAQCDAVITMLPTGSIVRAVYLQSPRPLAAALAPGTLAIDMSSSEPEGTRRLGAELVPRGIALVDAPVSGGVPGAEAGTLAIMIGGNDAQAIERAKPLLSSMGRRLFETGPLGSGHAMKALNNFCAAAAYAAAAEALIAGRRFGLDPARMVDVLNASTGRTFMSEIALPQQVLTRRFASGFAVGLLAKDVKIAAELADAVRLDAPLMRLVSERWSAARDRLGAERDNTEAILIWDGKDDPPR